MGTPRRWPAAPRHITAWFVQGYRHPVSFLLGLLLLPLALVLGATYQINAALWRQQALHHLGVSAHLAAEIVDETLTETLRFERLLAAQPGLREALRHHERERLTAQLQAILPFIPRVDLVMVTDVEGHVVASYPSELSASDHSVADTESFRGARQRGWQPYISAVYLRDGPEMAKVVDVIIPVVDGDTILGLVQVQHQVEVIKSWLQKLRVGSSGFLYVVDHHDQLVVFPFQVLPGQPKTVSSWPPVAQPVSEAGGTLLFTDPRSRQRWLAGVHPIGRTGWRVVAVQPEQEALQTFHHVFWSLGLLVALLAAIVVTIGLRWATLQTFSLELMRQNAKLLRQLQQRRFGGS